MGRASCCDKADVKKGPWSPEEDAILKAYIDKYGTGGNWIALPNKIEGLKRCGKSCRLRWLNYLRPNLKHGGFTKEEDNIICTLYISIGSRWSIIAAQLPGRTDNDIKNYWNTRLKKKLFGRRKQVNPKSFGIKEGTNGNNVQDHNETELSNSALERLHLHIQLQNLRNPALSSFYDNHSNPWPKLNPLVQQRMIQSLQIQQTLEHNTVSGSRSVGERKPDFYDSLRALHHDSLAINTLKMDDPQPVYSENLMLSYSDGSVPFNYSVAVDQINNLQSNNWVDQDQNEAVAAGGFMRQDQDHTSQFELNNNSKDNLALWSNNYIDDDTRSGPSISWDTSTSSFLHS